MTPLASYPSLDAFYSANPVRSASPEWDFGVMWYEPDAPYRWPVHRVSWVVETGELILFRQGGRPGASDTVRVIARIEKVGEYPYSRGDAWGEFNAAQPVERALDGWAEQSGNLAWLYARLANINTDTEVAA